MFWGKTKPITLNCYTYRSDVFNYFPIAEASKYLPEWVKTLKKPSKHPAGNVDTLKSCPAFIGYFSAGFILPLWSDIFLEVGQEGSTSYRWQYADQQSEMGFHSQEQIGSNFPAEKYQHFKLASPWVFSCDEDIDFLFAEPSCQFDKIAETVKIVDGIINFKWSAPTNINMFIKRKEADQEILLEAGTPMIHLFPLTGRKVVIKTHLVPRETYESVARKSGLTSFFARKKRKTQLSLKTKFHILP